MYHDYLILQTENLDAERMSKFFNIMELLINGSSDFKLVGLFWFQSPVLLTKGLKWFEQAL